MEKVREKGRMRDLLKKITGRKLEERRRKDRGMKEDRRRKKRQMNERGGKKE